MRRPRTIRAIFLMELLNESRSRSLLDWLTTHGQDEPIKRHAREVLDRLSQPQAGT